MIIFDVILPCPQYFHSVHPYWKMFVLYLSNKCLSHLQLSPQFPHFFNSVLLTGKWLSYSCLTALFLIYHSDLMIIFDVILPCPYCFNSVHPYCKIIVLFLFLQLSFYNSDLIIVFDVILPCPYCFHSVHPYWKINVLFLSNRCLSHLKLSPLFLTVFIVYTYTA